MTNRTTRLMMAADTDSHAHTSMRSPSEQDYIQQLSIDCVIFGFREGQLFVLVPKLIFEGDFRALPSGFISQHEDVDAAARRILQERTGIAEAYLEQFHTFGKASRNSMEFMQKLILLNPGLNDAAREKRKEFDWFTRRFVSIGYFALVNIDEVVPQKSSIDDSISWHPLRQLPQMIMDHDEIVSKALEALRLNLGPKLIAFYLLPQTFTMRELQELYEAVFDKPFARNNFQKMILDLNVLERLEKKFTGAANKAPYLYKLAKPKTSR